jgi:hypothetical protein
MKKYAARNWLKVCLLLFVIPLPLFLASCGGGISSAPFNTSGSWFIYHTTAGTAGDQGPDLFTFTQTDASSNNLTGTTSQSQLLSGNVSGLNISFSWVGSDGATYNYTGVISADAFTMSGTWTSTNGLSGTWHAIFSASPSVNISGSWSILFTTAGTTGQQGPFLFTFTQSGNGIAGTTSQGQQLIGTVSVLSITFSWAGSDGATNVYTGALNSAGTSMSGTWTSTNGLSGTWSATKSG